MKTYRILKYPWHTAHDYELAKIPHRFFYLSSTHRQWTHQHRPFPKSITWIADQSVQKTDFMILHLDQWSYTQPSKRFLFLKHKTSYKGPKIVINHGCNMVDGCTSETMRELVEGTFMVCNSSTAHKMWDVPNSRFIRHGMTPEEWPSTDYQINNTLIVQPEGEFYSAYGNHSAVSKLNQDVGFTWVGRDIGFDSFASYKNFLGKSSVYFNPSLASPNPRARTEAMLSGLAIVSTNSHGEDEYIENGVNGFVSNDFEELKEFLLFLRKNPEQAVKIGQAGRATAQKVFHIDNFIAQWNDLMAEYVS